MDPLLIQAPVGGAVSPVNDKLYLGGQFMPDTGEYCGAKKRAKKHASAEGENWAEVIVRGAFVYYRPAGMNLSKPVEKKPFESQAAAVAFAEEVIRLRAEAYRKRGFQPHPTGLIIA